MSIDGRIGIPRAAATRGNDRKRRAFSEFVILARVAAAREESRSFSGIRMQCRENRHSLSGGEQKRGSARSVPLPLSRERAEVKVTASGPCRARDYQVAGRR